MSDVDKESEIQTLKRCLELEIKSRKAAEKRVNETLAELTTINSALEQKVEERTREASEARDAALSASQAKSEFLATMSHEIRTPMNAIIGFAELLLNESMDERQHRFVQRIDTSGKALLQIINDILDYSKIEAGKLHIELIHFNFFELMDQMQHLFSQQVESKGVDLLFEIDPDIPISVEGDPLRISQIVTNLISNALKFTDSGTIKVTARVQKSSDGRAVVEVCCSDTGIGIPDEAQKKLFSSFTQADSSTTRKFGGTGLGLSICKSLSEMMGGGVWLMSRVGMGSSFFFTVDLKVLDAEQTAASETALHSLDDVSFPESRILLVEDNEINQELVKEMFKDVDVIPEVAFNGLEAVEKVKLKEYDLVFMDIQMPLMDGLQSTKRIREEFSSDELTIIAMTANASPEDRENCISVGMNDFLSKPIDHRLLIETMQRWLSKEAGSDIAPNDSAEDGSAEDGCSEGGKEADTTVVEQRQEQESQEQESIEADTAPDTEPHHSVNEMETVSADEKQNNAARTTPAATEAGLPKKKAPTYTTLDQNKALAMMGGKATLLDKMLKMFSDKYSSADLRLSEFIANKEWVEAQRFAHTVKGISANIAAERLAGISGTLEIELKAIVQDQSLVKNFDDELLLFSEELKKLLAEIAA